MVSRMLAFDTSADVTAVAVLEADEVIVEDSAASAERHAETLLPRIEECLARANLALSDIDVFAVGVGPGSFTGVRVGVATAKGLAFATGKPLRGVVSLAALAASVIDIPAKSPAALGVRDIPAKSPAALGVRDIPAKSPPALGVRDIPAKSPPALGVLEGDLALELFVAPILDAYKGEVFAALYSVTEHQTVLLAEPFHAAPEVAAAQIARAAEGRALRVLGSGYRRYAERIGPHWDAAEIRVLDPTWDTPHARHIAREARRLLGTEGASDVARLAPLYVRDSDAQLPKAPLRL
jgi:tRNA threonylcarbamoyl adenosine modification protein YeaZ